MSKHRTTTHNVNAQGVGVLVFVAVVIGVLVFAGTTDTSTISSTLPLTVGDVVEKPLKWFWGERPTSRPGRVPLASQGPTAPADPAVVQAIAEHVAAAEQIAGASGRTAISVFDASGNEVFARNSTEPMLPASTVKLVTAAAALSLFGPDHRFTTHVRTLSPPQNGVVSGDLVIYGGGDPTFVSPIWIDEGFSPERPSTPITVLVDAIAAAGVQTVTGDLVIDDGFFIGSDVAEGWPQRYFDDLDTAPITALTVDRGTYFFDETPEEEPLDLESAASLNPAQTAGEMIAEALAEQGVEIAGTVTYRNDGPAVQEPHRIVALDSPPLRVLLRRMMQNSDNHIADTVFRCIGRYDTGDGSFAASEEAVRTILGRIGVTWDNTRLADGSGLSRDSRVSAQLLTQLNWVMSTSPISDEWRSLFAVAGDSGTLRRRLVGTIAELRVHAKTGSLSDVRGLSGMTIGPDGQLLYFTMLANGFPESQHSAVRRHEDGLVLELLAYQYGCVPTPIDNVDLEAPPELPIYSC